MNEAFLVGGVRTPVGKFGGVLSSVRPDDLAALVVKTQVERTNIDQEMIDDVVLGNANQAGEDNRNVARMAALLAGLPDSVPGFTVNRLCASGLQAVASAAHEIQVGQSNVVVAGGVESMSRSPWVLARPAQAWARPSELVDSSLGWRFVNPRMKELDEGDATMSLGAATEKLAARYSIGREAADEYAVRSQQRASAASRAGWFDDEIVPVDTPTGSVELDETIREDVSLAAMSGLRPSFGGVTTAGNASPLSDGASAVMVASQEAIDRHELKPRARVVGFAVAGVAPSMFGLGPVNAIRSLESRTGVSMSEVDFVEINEAFAAQVLACNAELKIDPEKLNPIGGAIALGHPLGSSGCRIVVSALNHLERIQGKQAIVSMCIGVGQGAAMLIERCE